MHPGNRAPVRGPVVLTRWRERDPGKHGAQGGWAWETRLAGGVRSAGVWGVRGARRRAFGRTCGGHLPGWRGCPRNPLPRNPQKTRYRGAPAANGALPRAEEGVGATDPAWAVGATTAEHRAGRVGHRRHQRPPTRAPTRDSGGPAGLGDRGGGRGDVRVGPGRALLASPPLLVRAFPESPVAPPKCGHAPRQLHPRGASTSAPARPSGLSSRVPPAGTVHPEEAGAPDLSRASGAGGRGHRGLPGAIKGLVSRTPKGLPQDKRGGGA